MTSNIEIPIFIVDAFSKQPFGGNGAAICLIDSDKAISEDVMQRIAAEMNLSETAFISLLHDSDAFATSKSFGLRWFTPTTEVPLCGHATLASAAVLFTVLKNPYERLEFQTCSGTLVALKSSDSYFSIDLPAYTSQPVDLEIFGPLVKAVCSLPVQEVVISTSKKLIVRLQDCVTRQQLEEIKPVANNLLSAAPKGSVVGVIVTLKGSGQKESCSGEGIPYDFVSRYFAPWFGVPEDPVTGSAHSALGPYWAKVLGRTELFARQCSARGGDLKLNLQGDRIYLSGGAVVVLKGNFYL